MNSQKPIVPAGQIVPKNVWLPGSGQESGVTYRWLSGACQSLRVAEASW